MAVRRFNPRANAKHQFYGFLKQYSKNYFLQEFRKHGFNKLFGLRSEGVARCFKLDLQKISFFFLQISIRKKSL
jgi:hypothetical protein